MKGVASRRAGGLTVLAKQGSGEGVGGASASYAITVANVWMKGVASLLSFPCGFSQRREKKPNVSFGAELPLQSHMFERQ